VTVIVRHLGRGDDTRGAAGQILSWEAFTTPESLIYSHCRKMLDVQTGGLFIADAAGEPSGIATVSMQFGIEFGWLGELGDLHVVPALRGQGIARASWFTRLRAFCRPAALLVIRSPSLSTHKSVC